MSSPKLLSLEELVLKLYDVQGLKFGSFTMRTGEVTPVYIDMRVIWSYPDIVKTVAELLWQEVDSLREHFDIVCGLPYQGIPLATYFTTQYGVPMVLKRQQPKKYGTKKLLEGHYKPGDKCLLLDDVLMTGGTLVDDVPVFEEEGLKVSKCVVFFDREQGGSERTKKVRNVDVHRVLTLSKAFEFLLKAGKVDEATILKTKEYLQSNRFDTPEYGVHDGTNGFH